MINRSNGSNVFRIPPTEETALHLVALNQSLSFTARGIFVYLRFLPEPVTLAHLVNQCIVSGLTPIEVKGILQELVDGGFVQLTDAAIAPDDNTPTK